MPQAATIGLRADRVLGDAATQSQAKRKGLPACGKPYAVSHGSTQPERETEQAWTSRGKLVLLQAAALSQAQGRLASACRGTLLPLQAMASRQGLERGRLQHAGKHSHCRRRTEGCPACQGSGLLSRQPQHLPCRRCSSCTPSCWWCSLRRLHGQKTGVLDPQTVAFDVQVSVTLLDGSRHARGRHPRAKPTWHTAAASLSAQAAVPFTQDHCSPPTVIHP